MALVVFSHGNSFPGGTYSVLFRSLRARGFTVRAIDRFGHDPRYPVTSNWPTSPPTRWPNTSRPCIWWAIRWAVL